jgi:hypothetical protein
VASPGMEPSAKSMGLYSWQDRHASKTGQRLQS